MRTVREKEEELTLFDEGEKLRCEGEGDSILTRQTIFPFFFFFFFFFFFVLCRFGNEERGDGSLEFAVRKESN